MRSEERLTPEVLERVERGVRALAGRPMPSLRVGDGCEGSHRYREREVKLIGSARLGLVPMLIDGEEWFKHKDALVAEDLSLMADWHEAEARFREAEAERALFVEDVLRDLREIGHTGDGYPVPSVSPGIRAGVAWILDRLKRVFFR